MAYCAATVKNKQKSRRHDEVRLVGWVTGKAEVGAANRVATGARNRKPLKRF
jgi:hypothetical protein